MADEMKITEAQLKKAFSGHKHDPIVAVKLIKSLWAIYDSLDNMTIVMADLAYEIRQLRESLPRGPA